MRRLLLLLSITSLFSGIGHGADGASEPLKEYACSFSVQTSDGLSEAMKAPGLKVLDPPPDQPKFIAEAGGDVTVDGVLCWRSRAEFVPSDYRVLAAGYPLYLKHDDAGPHQGRALVVEKAAGVYAARLIAGPELAPDERRALDAIVEQFNARSIAEAGVDGKD